MIYFLHTINFRILMQDQDRHIWNFNSYDYEDDQDEEEEAED